MQSQQPQLRAAPPPPKIKGTSSILSKITGSISASPLIAFAVIVILVVIILYTYVKSKGWFGLGKKPSDSMKRSRTESAEATDDVETMKLIDELNNAS